MGDATEIDLLEEYYYDSFDVCGDNNLLLLNRKDLKQLVGITAAIKDSLEKDGTLGRINGEIRAGVMAILNRDYENKEPPKVPEETKLINELIREYLAWNGYLYTEQILAAESGQKNERLGRDVLTTKFGVMDDSKTAKVPLLYYIVSAFQNLY